MNFSTIMTTACAGLSLAGCATMPGARDVALRTMGDGQTVAAPRGFVEMCATQPDLCRGSETDAAPASIDAQQLRKTLAKVNRLVNSRVVQQSDMIAFGRYEVWRRSGIGPLARGDCEDLAIEKRERLVASGVPRAMLFFATAWRADLGLHTLLVARTPDGDVVLDSRTPYVQPWRRVPYLWISRQHSDQPTHWSTIEETPTYRVATFDRPGPAIATGASGALPLQDSSATAPRGSEAPADR